MTETQVQLDQLEAWDQALEEGRTLLTEAASIETQAKQAQSYRQWEEAAERFRQAHNNYASAAIKLAAPAAIEATAYRALQQLRDEASRLLKQAQEALDEYDRVRWVEMCERNIVVALEMQQQAESALSRGYFDTARSLANQAGEMNPALRQDTERTMRAALELASANEGKIGMIISIVIVAIVLGVVISLWF